MKRTFDILVSLFGLMVLFPIAALLPPLRGSLAPCVLLQVFYYRTRSGLEIDVLLQTPRGLLALEVKGRDAVGTSDIGSMKRIADKLGTRWLGGLVVYRGDRLEEIEPGFWAVPSYRLFA